MLLKHPPARCHDSRCQRAEAGESPAALRDSDLIMIEIRISPIIEAECGLTVELAH